VSELPHTPILNTKSSSLLLLGRSMCLRGCIEVECTRLVQPPRPQQRRVNHVGAVGRRHQKDALPAVDAVHLCEELVDHPAGAQSGREEVWEGVGRMSVGMCVEKGCVLLFLLPPAHLSAAWFESVPLLGASASISSKNSTHGCAARARANSCLTALSLSPTYLFSSSGPCMFLSMRRAEGSEWEERGYFEAVAFE
jgi:hypothetical protein